MHIYRYMYNTDAYGMEWEQPPWSRHRTSSCFIRMVASWGGNGYTEERTVSQTLLTRLTNAVRAATNSIKHNKHHKYSSSYSPRIFNTCNLQELPVSRHLDVISRRFKALGCHQQAWRLRWCSPVCVCAGMCVSSRSDQGVWLMSLSYLKIS